jgi:membrane protease YdiL (CAAX protease family)
VPWSGVWVLLPVLLVLLTLYSAFVIDDTQEAAIDSAEVLRSIASGSAMQVVLAVAFLVVVAATSRPTLDDLGIPTNWVDFFRCVRIGAIAWLAALLPVYTTAYFVMKVFGQAEKHPLIEMLVENPSTELMLIGAVAAVIVAPICEEIIFRLLLQGWLEKWEDSVLGWRQPVAPVEVAVLSEGVGPDGATITDSTPIIAKPPAPDELPPQVGLGGLPYGFAPIALSSMLFALAHAQVGTDPIPIFVLALALGFVYQRTHRIIPSMVTHALFNGMSLLMLWRMIAANAE